MFEIVWSGTLEREGKCGGLSGYYGPSQLAVQMPDTQIVGAATLTKPKRHYVSAKGPTMREQIETRLDAGMSLYQAMRETGASQRTANKIAFAREQRLF
jgi:hypothetical protein